MLAYYTSLLRALARKSLKLCMNYTKRVLGESIREKANFTAQSSSAARQRTLLRAEVVFSRLPKLCHDVKQIYVWLQLEAVTAGFPRGACVYDALGRN